jgi:hypothetical protein
MKTLKAMFQWIILICIGIVLYLGWIHRGDIHPAHSLNNFEIIGLSLCLAFMWVEVLKWGVTKPFNCVKCMTAWISLLIGCSQIGWFGIIFLPVGLFVGAMWEAIKDRWL